MKALWLKYVRDPFRRALIEVPWFGPVVSAVLVALLVNILTEALTAWGGLWMGVGAGGVLALATETFVYAYSIGEALRRRRGIGPISDRPNPPKARGLIFMFSTEETLREAIAHHRPHLAHCWLLTTPARQEQAAAAVEKFSPDPTFTLHALQDLFDSQGCYQVVAHIYRQEAPRLGIAPGEVIADITGGTKPMTLGMILACLEGDHPIEHVPTAYDATGRATRPLPPIQIVVHRS